MTDKLAIALGFVGSLATVLTFIYGVLKMNKPKTHESQNLKACRETFKYIKEKVQSVGDSIKTLFQKIETSDKSASDLKTRVSLSELNIKHLTELQVGNARNTEKIFNSIDGIKNILMTRRGKDDKEE